MLSAIGRASTRRVVAIRPKSTNSIQALLERADGSTSVHKYPYQLLASFSSSVSRQIAAATTKKSAKKPAAKKTVTKKALERPTKTKAKKAKVVKPKPKKKVVTKKKPLKKVLTPEQKIKQQNKVLKTLALTPPKPLPYTTVQVYVANLPKKPAGVSQPEFFKAEVAKYKSVTPSELEALNHTANQNKATNAAAFAKWVRSHTPEQIKTANNARVQLRRKDGSKRAWRKIEDSRLPSQPRNTFAIFTKSRHASGDLKGISISDASRILKDEFVKLSASEKQALESEAAADRLRYEQEYKTVYGHDNPTAQKLKA